MTIGREEMPYRCFAKLFARWSPRERLLRLGRIVWRRGEGPGGGKGYSAKLSLALTPSLVQFRRDWCEWSLTLLGVRVHYLRSYGGWIP